MKNNVFKKVFIIIIFVLIPIITGLGFASWYVVTEYRIKPKYNPDSAFYIYLHNQSATYTGSGLLPHSEHITIDSSVSYEFKEKGAENYTTGMPVDAGEYYIRFESNKDIEGFEPTDVLFTITPADITPGVVKVVYDNGSYFTTSKNTSEISYTCTNSFKFNGTNVEGSISYDNDKNGSLKIGKHDYSYIFTPDSKNFNIYADGKTEIITYATVTFLDEDGSPIHHEYALNEKISKPDPNSYTPVVYPGEKDLEDWYYNDVAFDFENTEITSDISLQSKWIYKTYTLSLVNVAKDGDNFVYSTDTYTTTFTVLSLNLEIDEPLTGIKYFRDWYGNGLKSDTKNFSITKTGDITYTARWFDIVSIGDKTYNHSDYTTTRLTNTTVFNDIINLSNISIKDSTSTINTTNYLEVKAMHNGYYYYGDLASIPLDYRDSVKANSSTNLAGSTYLAYIYVKNMAPFVVLDNITGEYIKSGNYSTIIVTYKTAVFNSTNCTIEEAIASANNTTSTISLNGNSSNYVETCFTNIDFDGILENYSFTYTLNKAKILVPFNNSTTEKSEGADSGDIVYSALTIPSNIKLELKSSASVVVGAEVAHLSTNYATKIRAHGVLFNDGTIDIFSGSSITSYGFTKGSGLINLQSGSSATDCMTTFDWPGGSAATSIVSKVFPTNAWSMHNISCPTKINQGSTYYAFLYATMTGGTISTTVNIVHPTGSSCLFYSTTAGSYIYKYTKPADLWEKNQSTYSNEYKSLSTISGNNQIQGQRDILEIYGTYSDSSFSVKFTYKITFISIPVTISTSTTISCPLGYSSVIIKSGATLNLSKADYLFLPGTTLTLEEGATLNTSNGADLSFECVSNINSASGTKRFYDLCPDKTDAKFILNGTANISAAIGGIIETNSNQSVLKITGTPYTKFLSLANTSRPYYYTVSNYYSRGYINDASTFAAFAKDTYRGKIDANGNYYWKGDNNSIGTTSNLTGSFSQ